MAWHHIATSFSRFPSPSTIAVGHFQFFSPYSVALWRWIRLVSFVIYLHGQLIPVLVRPRRLLAAVLEPLVDYVLELL